jgi:carbamoyltransferase
MPDGVVVGGQASCRADVGKREEGSLIRILGISCYYHDSVTVSDGQLIAAAMEERFTRLKHDSRFPSAAIRFCLDARGVKAPNRDYLVFYE